MLFKHSNKVVSDYKFIYISINQFSTYVRLQAAAALYTRSSLFSDVTKRFMAFTDLSGIATQSHLQGSACFTLEFGVPIDCPETSVTNHQSRPCNIPEEPRPHTFNDLRFFYDRMTVHRNIFLVNKTNRSTEIQFYWYYYSTCFGQPFCPSSGVLNRASALVHFMQL